MSRAADSDAFSLVAEKWRDGLCRWCRKPIDTKKRIDADHCSKVCRQAAFRARKLGVRREASSVDGSIAPRRFAYLDPPYVGLAARFYRHEPSFAGEVDHAELVRRVAARGLDGWALSCSVRSLDVLLPLVRESIGKAHRLRLCAWVKPGGAPRATFGIHNKWEAVIVVDGRFCRPGVRDFLVAHAARGGGELPGRKPLHFCAWLFDLLGMIPGDSLEDWFPGTGIVSATWREMSSLQQRDTSPVAGDERRLFLPHVADAGPDDDS